LIPLSDEREQHFGLLGALFDVADVVQNQQLGGIEPAQQARQRKITLGGEQFLNQLIGGPEQHRVALPDQRVAECGGGVALTHSGRAEGQQVDSAFQELAARQFAQLAPQGWLHEVEVEGLEGLAGRQLGSAAQRAILRCSRASASISNTSRTKPSTSCCPACSSRRASSLAAVVRLKRTSSSLVRSDIAAAVMTPPRCRAVRHRSADPAARRSLPATQ